MRSTLLPLFMLCACSNPTPGTVQRAIVGGTIDNNTKAVVGLGVNIGMFFGHCTGTLIAPNLVLTARHCVSLTQSPGNSGGVICGQTQFTLQGPGSIFRATVETVRPKVDGPKFYPGVGDVFVEKQATDICGYDVALIVLKGKGIPASVATPIEPRIDQSAVEGEMMSAVGYGLTTAGGTESGTRMRIDGRKVLCFQQTCSAMVMDSEFGSDAPTCQGDSGGPALDDKGRVFGVLSRGPTGCKSSVFGDVASKKDLIIEAAKAAAKEGGYPLPVWAGGTVTPDMGPADLGTDTKPPVDSALVPDAEVVEPGGGGCSFVPLGQAP